MNRMSAVKSSLRRVKDTVIRERLLMVQASYQKPLRDVAKTFGYTHGKVDYWKKRYETQGLHGLYTKPRSGRPPKISQEQTMQIRRTVRKHNIKKGWRTQHVRELIVGKTGVKYSSRDTIRILQSWGLAKITPRPRSAFSKKEDRKAFQKKTRSTWHISRSDGQ